MVIKKILKKSGVLIWPLVFLLLIILDQALKHSALRVFKNYQFAFSLPVPVVLIYIIYFLILTAIICFVVKKRNLFSFVEKLSWTFVLAGAFSNIVERIITGYVKDFIYITFFRWTGIYNLADGYIIAGIVLLLFGSLIFNDKNNKN